jgi:hypothetical protein
MTEPGIVDIKSLEVAEEQLGKYVPVVWVQVQSGLQQFSG